MFLCDVVIQLKTITETQNKKVVKLTHFFVFIALKQTRNKMLSTHAQSPHRNKNENEEYDDNDEQHFIPNETQLQHTPWDNSINYQQVKPNAIHFQSTHWDNRVSAKHFKPNAKFINVSFGFFFRKLNSNILTKQMSNRPTNSMPLNESELVMECRRGLVDGTVKDPMQHIRMICLARGAAGIYNLGR